MAVGVTSVPTGKIPGGGIDPKLGAMLHQVKNSAWDLAFAAAAKTRVAMEAGQQLTKEIRDLPEGDPALSDMKIELADLKERRRVAKTATRSRRRCARRHAQRRDRRRFARNIARSLQSQQRP